MYLDEKIFKKPSDENIKIWKYLDFTKFVSLLQKESLFFSRVDALIDPFEGASPKDMSSLRLAAEAYGDPRLKVYPDTQGIRKEMRKSVYVNSWHMNEYESAAMWSLYLTSPEGVAIQTTYKHLSECFASAKEDIHFGEVTYIDYDKDFIPAEGLLSPFLHKRKSYAHEKELRVLLCNSKKDKKQSFQFLIDDDFGKDISCNIDVLIEKVYVSPYAQKWFSDLVKSVICKYGFKKEIVSSSLLERPMF